MIILWENILDNNNLKRFIEKISKKSIAIGTSTSIGEPIVADILCNCGFDFIWIDGEHSPIDRRDINTQIITISGGGLAPFVRVPWNDPVLVKPILDMGPAAIIFPFIKTVKDTKLAVASCRYPLKGIRGFSPIRANNYSTMNNSQYFEISESQPWVIPQIEHIDGVNNLDDIIKVEGVDTIAVGPNDLSGSIGLLGQTRHPKVLRLLDKIANICNEANFPFGVSLGWCEENVIEWIDRGISWICVDGDISYLINGGKSTYKKINKLIDKSKNK